MNCREDPSQACMLPIALPVPDRLFLVNMLFSGRKAVHSRISSTASAVACPSVSKEHRPGPLMRQFHVMQAGRGQPADEGLPEQVTIPGSE